MNTKRKDDRIMQRSKQNITRPLLTVLTLTIGLLPVALAAGQSGNKPASQTLYQRIGGYDGITAYVDTVFPRVATNPKLERLFKGHSVDSQHRQRQLLIEFLCHETGGSCVYLGRPMKPLHKGLNITEDDWTTFIKIVADGIEETKWPAAEKKEFLAIFQHLKADVVEQK
jgi:hemoglobin